MILIEKLLGLISLLFCAVGEIPDIFDGVFTTFWVFLVVTILLSVVFFVFFIVIFIFIIRTVIKRSKQVDEVIDYQIEQATKEIKCQYCETKLDHTMTQCPNCGAPKTE